VDFSSDHVPGLGELIVIWGTVEPSPFEVDTIFLCGNISSSEIDEIAWCPRSADGTNCG